jgi:predicted DNA-binding transcriptional regulator AlpA
MSEIDSAMAAQILGISRQHFVDRISKRADFPKPVTLISRKTVRWRYADVLRFKEGKR